jgi:hypothetical protein
MSVNTQNNHELKVTFGGKTFECQIIDLDFKRPGRARGSIVRTACPDGVVSEPGEITEGSLTGNAYTDTTDSGLWWLLDEAYESETQVDYVLTFFPDLGATKAVEFTGKAYVTESGLGFTNPAVSKHPIALTVVTATKSRPAVVTP